MINYPFYRNFTAKIVVISIAVALASCNAVKKVPEEEFLLIENTIYADSVPVKSSEVRNLLAQKPTWISNNSDITHLRTAQSSKIYRTINNLTSRTKDWKSQ